MLGSYSGSVGWGYVEMVSSLDERECCMLYIYYMFLVFSF